MTLAVAHKLATAHQCAVFVVFKSVVQQPALSLLYELVQQGGPPKDKDDYPQRRGG
jgi:hypothetical protein